MQLPRFAPRLKSWSSPHSLEECWERLDHSIHTSDGAPPSPAAAVRIAGRLQINHFHITRKEWPKGIRFTGVLESTGDQTRIHGKFHVHWSQYLLFALSCIGVILLALFIGPLLLSTKLNPAQNWHKLLGASLLLGMFLTKTIGFARNIARADPQSLEQWICEVLNVSEEVTTMESGSTSQATPTESISYSSSSRVQDH